MEKLDEKAHSDVLCYNPLAYEQKLIVNSKHKTLEELRQSFKPEASSVLSQVRDFLPKLATANEELQKRLENEPASTFDIEEIETDRPHIQMDLALFEEGSSEEESDSSDDSEDVTDNTEINEDNLKLTQGKTKAPVIQVLSETDRLDCDETNCDNIKADRISNDTNRTGGDEDLSIDNTDCDAVG